MKNMATLNSTKKTVYLGWLVVGMTFGIFIVWASFAPLDKGVVVDGNLIVAGNRKIIQAQEKGIVSDILVEDGQWVKKGQLLVRLDGSATQAEYDAARLQYYSNIAQKLRLQAERNGTQIILNSTLLAVIDNDDSVKEALQLQERFLLDSKRIIESDKQVFVESRLSTSARIAGLKNVINSLDERLALYDKRINNVNELVEQGFAAKDKLDELQLIASEARTERASAQADLQYQVARIREINAQLTQLVSNHNHQLSKQLIDSQMTLDASFQKYKAAELIQQSRDVVASVSGQVVSLNIHSQGGVVKPAEILMEIVPHNKQLVADVQIPVDVIDSIHMNQVVELMFTSFNRSQTPKVDGKVVKLATDRQINENTGQPYYAASIAFDSGPTNQLALQPGMPVQAFMSNGERSMLSYLFKPVFDRIPKALAEN